MSEEKSLNIYQKLQKCKVELQKKSLKKSAYNDYGKYNYFELGDFIPDINELCEKYQIFNFVTYPNDTALLTLEDLEEKDSKIEWSMPFKVTPLKNCTEMQSIGAAQTYARKYLYETAFEISEHDSLDGGESKIDSDEEEARAKINPVKLSTIKELILKVHADEKAFLKYYKIKSLDNMTNEIFVTAMQQLQKKQEKMEAKQKTQTALERAKAAQKNKNNNLPDLGI